MTTPTPRPVQLYAPCYLSNFCVNHCSYCAFRFDSAIQRRHLGPAEIEQELGHLRRLGLRRVVLVSADFPARITVDYLLAAVESARRLGLEPHLETAPRSDDDYRRLAAAGGTGVVLYQETYDEARYRWVHPRGPKSKMDVRLEAPARAAAAGFRKIGIGVLLGLAPPEPDVLALADHARRLLRRFPRLELTINLPRLRQVEGGLRPPFVVPDDQLVALYEWLHDALPDVALVVSTRERPRLRASLIAAGASLVSAGSSTRPGGYTRPVPGDAQFSLADERPVHVVRAWLEALGYQPTE